MSNIGSLNPLAEAIIRLGSEHPRSNKLGSSGSFGFDLDVFNQYLPKPLFLDKFSCISSVIDGIEYRLCEHPSLLISEGISSAVVSGPEALLHYHNLGPLLVDRAISKEASFQVDRCIYLGQEDTANLYHFLFFEIPHIVSACKYWQSHGTVFVYLGHEVPSYAYDLISLFGILNVQLIPPTNSPILSHSVMIPSKTNLPISTTYPILNSSCRLGKHLHLTCTAVHALEVLIIDRRLSCNGSPNRVIYNLADLVDSLSSYKVHVVRMEDHPISDQISFVRSASIIIAMHGAALSHILFATPGTVVIELRHFRHIQNHTLYQQLSVARGIQHVNISCSQPDDIDLDKSDVRNIPIIAPLDQVVEVCRLTMLRKIKAYL